MSFKSIKNLNCFLAHREFPVFLSLKFHSVSCGLPTWLNYKESVCQEPQETEV